MKMLKKAICVVLAVCSMATACVTFAAEPETVQEKTKVTVQDGEIEDIVPIANEIALDSSIADQGASWHQKWGYKYYRVWIVNAGKYDMKVTITGGLSEPDHSYTVPAGKGKNYTVKNAGYGKHKISFSTADGKLMGTVRVRISEEAL